MNSFFLSGLRIDDVSLSEILQIVQSRLSQKQWTHLFTVNATLLLEAAKDASLKNLITPQSLCVAESVGITLLAKLKKNRSVQRIPGIDLMRHFCTDAAERGQKVFLLGAAPGVAECAAQKLQQQISGLQVAAAMHGYFSLEDEPSLLQKIQESGASFLFVALAMPRQECWIARNAEYFRGMVVMGVGGSFDVLSEKLKRAPFWMQRFGMEWLFRLWQEPKRCKRILRLPLIFFIED